MMVKNAGQNFVFGDDPVAQIRRQARHIAMPRTVIIALACVGAARFGRELGKAIKGGGARW